jgi:tetratricopeptide (TPR) repeat protein
MNLGKVYLALDKNDLALNYFKRVLEVSPDNEECLKEINELSVK